MAANPGSNVHRCRILFMLVFILFQLVSPAYQNKDGVSKPQLYQPKNVHRYEEYRNVQLYHFKIPSQVTEALWQFTGFLKGDASCPYENVQIALQWGSYPVIDPTNSSFPENTLLKRTSLLEMETPSDMTSLYLKMTSPLSGDWFAAVYLPPLTEAEKIQPKGFGDDCSYYLGSILQYHREIDITALTIETEIPQRLDYTDTSVVLKFFIADNVGSVTFTLEGCQFKTPVVPVENICAVKMAVQPGALPASYNDWTDCAKESQENGTCQLTVKQPKRSVWYYVKVARAIQNASIGFAATVSVEDCENGDNLYLYSDPSAEGDTSSLSKHKVNVSDNYVYEDSPAEMTVQHKQKGEDVYASQYYDEVLVYRMYMQDELPYAYDDIDDADTCLPDAPMQRDKYPARFTILYSHIDSLFNTSMNVVNIEPLKASVLSFETRSIVEIGSHIRIEVKLLQESNSTENVSVAVCLRNGAPPHYEDGQVHCEAGMFSFVNSSLDHKILHMPYPEPGVWYVSLSAQCYKNVSGVVKYQPCSEVVEVLLNVKMEPCMMGCNGHGQCRTYYSGELLFATCVCENNYRGWACTNDTYADSESHLLLEMLLLSLSNLFFLPAIILSAYRFMFVESLVYFYTMFFSGFYHVCDSDGFCIMDYDTLQYCDFLASVLSVWVTVVAMAVLKPQQTSFLHMFGTLALIAMTKYDRFSIWIFVAPVLVGLVLIIASWIYKCRTSRSCFPGIRHTIAHFIPGIFTAGTALILYTFVETETNYYYVHSLWHTLIALSVVFLLPPKPRKSKKYLRRTPSSEDMLGANDDEEEEKEREIPQPGHKMYKRRRLYPSGKRWLLFIIPGLLLAGVGLIVYSFVENEENYYITHSIWHVCMSMCIVFLLPPRRKTDTKKETEVYTAEELNVVVDASWTAELVPNESRPV